MPQCSLSTRKNGQEDYPTRQSTPIHSTLISTKSVATMKLILYVKAAILALTTVVRANDPIPGSFFRNNNGVQAAELAAPAWYMPDGTCMASAAEDGHGNQMHGLDADNCNILKLNNHCPQQPASTGQSTVYHSIPGQPFDFIPTYYNVVQCDGDRWDIIYYVYFQKDTGHMHDWEGITIQFRQNGGDTYVRDTVVMEQDGKHRHIGWNDVNDTFDNVDGIGHFANKGMNHGMFYFGKFHHPVHHDWHTGSFKNTCPPTSDDDYRSPDYQWWSVSNLRHVSVLNPNWNWGKASSPANINVCLF